MKKYFFLWLAIVTICIALFSACKEPVTDVTLNKNELHLIIGETETLIATIQPANASNDKVTWTSNNPDVATVNDNGLVTAMDNGTATITVTSQDGNKTATCEVTVDYRSQWVGDWDFTTIDYVRYYYPDIYSDSLVVKQDTIHFVGTINKHGSDRLKIIFKPNATEPDFTKLYAILQIYGLIYPVIDDSGTLTYPDFRSNGDFYGSFLGNEIDIYYYHYGPQGQAAYENHNIKGVKINK